MDLFNVDISQNSNDGEKNSCTVTEVLGFEVFETIILTLIFLGMIFAAYKLIVRGKHFIVKQREKRAQEENRKFEEMRLQYQKRQSKARNSAADSGTWAEDTEMGSAQDLEKMAVKFKYSSDKDDQ